MGGGVSVFVVGVAERLRGFGLVGGEGERVVETWGMR
jgi:hypothetical protein